MAHQGGEGFRLAVQERIKPHIAHGVQAFLPTHFARVVHPLAHQFRLLGTQGPFDQDIAVALQLVQFIRHILHFF